MELPVYIQIHNKIKKDIEIGRWAVGDRIPSERELALTFEVSRMTLRQAVQTLVDEGILERRIGAGTYVANQKVQEKMSGVTSFTALMHAQGKEPSSKTISYHVANPSLSEAEQLQLKEDQKILRMERIRYADQVPICFEVATVPHNLVADFSKAEITQSLYQTLETHGLKMSGAKQTVTAQLASERIADFLKIKRNGSILKLRQVSFLESGQPFEYVRTQYAGDRFEFYLER